MKFNSKKRPSIVELFSGVGGFSLGVARAGFSLVGAIDNDSRAMAAHSCNFPGSKHWITDISNVTGDDIVARFKVPTGIIGGPPCQGFSYIGKNDDLDTRNKLFVDFFRIVKECSPVFFLAENVPGILGAKYNDIREKAFSHVAEEYIMMPPMKFTASDYGAPTSRTRIFFFGYLRGGMRDLKPADFDPTDNIEFVKVKDALKGLPKKIDLDQTSINGGWMKVGVSFNGSFGARLNGNIPIGVGEKDSINALKNNSLVSGCLGTHHSKKVARRYSAIKPGKSDSISKSRRLEAAGFCPTLRAGTGSERGSYQAVRPLHPTENRVITPREAARLQGFPDWFQFDTTIWHSFRQIGNSVSPILAEHLLSVINKALINKE